MSKSKIVGSALFGLFIFIQFIPFQKPIVKMDNEDDLITINTVEQSVAEILRVSCYNCHSNETVYPWYGHVAPVSWLVSSDIRQGRKHLNFSEWELFNKLDKAKLLNEIADEVNNGEMPMSIYVLMHPKAKLSKEDTKKIANWTEQFGGHLFSANTENK